MRNSFLFRKEYFEILKSLSKSQRAELTILIIEYGICGEEKKDISEKLKPIFNLIKDRINQDCVEYGFF